MSKRADRIVVITLILAMTTPSVLGESGSQVDMSIVTKEHEVVPCLLPARVRKIGNLTYPERRRLIEASARNCRLKGGEFTHYDRAKPESAVAFFSGLAESGDVDAQVSLGDVYQYLYVEADYDKAAHWYQRASDAGSKQGMMQLARLYERGLGVAADPLMATNLWREATGAGEELVLASELEAAKTQAASRISELTNQLRQSNEQTEAVRYELAQARTEVQTRRASLQQAQAQLADIRGKIEQAAASEQNAEQLAQLRTRLTGQERTIEEQRFQIASLEDNLGVREAQLSANLRKVERQNQRLNEELSKVTATADEQLQLALSEVAGKDQEVASLERRLAEAKSELQNAGQAYASVSGELEVVRSDAADNQRAQRRIGELESQSAKRLMQLNEQRRKTSELENLLVRTTAEADQLKGSLSDQIDESAESEARFATVEAELERVRVGMGELQNELLAANQALASTTRERDGLRQQVAASSGDNAKVEQVEVALARQDSIMQEQQVQIAKLNEQVEEYAAELTNIRLRRNAIVMRSPMLDTSGIRVPPGVKVGKFYAIVIGNNNYQYLTDLQNAHSDARAVHELLQSEYRFNSELLLDATGSEIYEAFGNVTAKLEENDLVLIYYAGHGHSAQSESYWLPVETKSKDYADDDGLSSYKISRWVRQMPAKHVMIVADSCYSGSGIETSGGFRYDIKTLEASLPFFLKSKSRTMLSSGGEAPVMDGDGADGDHSVFAEAFLGLLSENQGVLHAGALHDYLVERVKFSAQGAGVRQTPQFGSIESAGHENGQFVFLHRSVRT